MMNDQDLELIEKHYGLELSSKGLMKVQGPYAAVSPSHLIDLCRKAEQMEGDIKSFCQSCKKANQKNHVPWNHCDFDCWFHQYEFWKEVE